MQSRSFVVASLSVVAVLLCSCSAKDGQGGRQPNESADTSTAPNISPSAAPGVAFNFAYEFSLPDEKIAATQEAHASTCEHLGLARCRITGMSYSVDQNEQVTAELDLKLDPLIAREFGKSAQQTVVAQDGKLIRLDIGSSDEGQAIAQASKQRGVTSTQIAQLQQELAKTKSGTSARANLLTQIQSLQQQASEQSQIVDARQAVLASTPMAFHYYGRGGVPGFHGNPFREAWQTLVTTVVLIVGYLLRAIAVVLPVLILMALWIAIWRTRPVRILRRWVKGPQEASD